MLPFLAMGAAVYGMAVDNMQAVQRALLFYPDPQRPDPGRWGAADFELVGTRTEDGLDITGWYHPPAADDRPVVVLFHGNAGHVGHRVFKARELTAAGFGVFLAGYRGFGGNPGSPGETGFMRDAAAQIGWLGAKGIGTARLVLYGESLGTAVAVRIAHGLAGRATPVAAVVLETPFTSLADVAQHHYPLVPFRSIIVDRFDALRDVAQVGAPVLVLHGDRDDVVPQRLGRQLYDAATDPKEAVWIPGGHHNDLWSRGAGDAIVRFVTARTR
jgi:fermentation-respiration switch protein FrsA (DUF1100 family)